MSRSHPLAEAFLGVAGEPREGASAELEETLAAKLAESSAAWSGIQLDQSAFLSFLAEKSRGETSPGRALESLRVAELYLTCACARGDPQALAAFDARYLSNVEPALARIGVTKEAMDETKQILRRRLLVREQEGTPPLIVQYSGIGPLRAWVTVAATRTVLNLLRDGGREIPTEVAALEALVPVSADPELGLLKDSCRQAVQAALGEAIEALGPRELGLLQLHYAEGLTTRELGSLYRVHQTTAADWLAAATRAILAGTKRALRRRLAVSPAECESMIRLVQSQLELTLRGFFTG